MFLFFVVVAKKGGLILESNVSKSTVCAEVGKGRRGRYSFFWGRPVDCSALRGQINLLQQKFSASLCLEGFSGAIIRFAPLLAQTLPRSQLLERCWSPLVHLAQEKSSLYNILDRHSGFARRLPMKEFQRFYVGQLTLLIFTILNPSMSSHKMCLWFWSCDEYI